MTLNKYIFAATLLIPASTSVSAQTAPDAIPPEIVVFGRGESKIGTATAASEGTVAGADLLVRPLLRVAELLEAVPGMIAAQHSGSGKANQYFLRGFNLDHGSDFTTYIDGVQMNLRTHGHGQGYLDLNGLIPEIVEREDYRKGPYRAAGGDFALAGAAMFQTVSRFDKPWFSVEAGSYGAVRLAGGATVSTAGGSLTVAAQAKHYDGPWAAPERLRHYSAFAKLSRPVGDGALALSLHLYDAHWNPTEQIPDRIIGSAVCRDVFCAPDPSARGQTRRVIVDAAFMGDTLKANVYSQYYDWSMYSNPTYANADGSSAQIFQFDRRWVFGLRGEKTWSLGPMLELTVGTENRYDAIGRVGVANTNNRQFIASLGAYRVAEGSAAIHGEAVWRPFKGARVTAGLRGDHYRYDVKGLDDAARAIGEGGGSADLVSPKLAVAYALSPHLELYANCGRGYHSNDVRGAVTATPVPVLVRGTGKEVGARLQAGKLNFTATYWWLDVGSELRFVGDSNAVEPSGASRRRGYEVVGFWRPFAWLALDASYTASHARYENGDFIPNAFENAGQVGVSVVAARWEAAARLRHLGPYPLIEDNSDRDPGSNVVNVRAAYRLGQFQLYAEALNLLDSRDNDISYRYTSYVPAFDAAPTDGRLSRVVEPRTLKIGIKTSLCQAFIFRCRAST
ncbi:TonB-dependent receptor [Sphingomonas sp.]|uniref:TonB-dependent receptor n=1 Tax=Sphingomonas sp. TaxID=28214 RepID=UPI0025EBC4CD|nr:TonB-dependent receptor [Sphingomonas sp.]